MKEVLVIYYSQTGQLRDILDHILHPFEDDNKINVTYHEILPETPYPFPWKKEKFFDVFPESFLQIPTKIKRPKKTILDKRYDLVLLGHQVWYLSPSIPLNSFLKSEYAKKILKDTPTITIIGARNMWVMSQEKVKKLLVGCKAQLVGNIALVDKNINHISVITIVHWMMKGKKDRLWGIFPKPGVSSQSIQGAKKFGEPIKESLLNGNFLNLQQELVHLGAVRIKPSLVLMDKRANLLFSKWANFIIKKGRAGSPARTKWLRFFNYYLLIAIWAIAPIVFIVFLITYIPLYNKIKREEKYYASVELKE